MTLILSLSRAMQPFGLPLPLPEMYGTKDPTAQNAWSSGHGGSPKRSPPPGRLPRRNAGPASVPESPG